MDQGEMAQQGLKELDTDNFRGLTLEQLDKHLQRHGQDTLNIYLGWLQEQLNVWDLSDPAVLRPQVESWCSNLRLHGFNDQRIFDAFAIWKTNEIANDACNARRVLVAEEELHSILSLGQANEQNSPQAEQSRADIITVQDDQVVVVSSGAEDSDVEFLGWKSPNHMHDTTKHVVDKINTNYYRITAANKENQSMHGTTDDGYNAPWATIGARKKPGNKQRRGPLPEGYVCDRCHKKGHHKHDCPTNLDPSYDVAPNRPYRCRCCHAYQKHLTELCPENQDFWSLTQQRIRAGVNANDPAGSIELDHYRPSYSVSRKREREYEHEPFGSIDNIYMHEDRRNLLDLPDHHSSQPDNNKERNEGSHYSPPLPAKRSRVALSSRKLDQQGEQSKRRRQNSRRSRGPSPSSGSKNGGSTELLPRLVRHNSETDGRLSYWDDGYDDVQMLEPSHLDKRPAVNRSWPAEGQEAVLRRLFPGADAHWVSSMASFDTDNFLDELDDFMENRGADRGSADLQIDPGPTMDCIEAEQTLTSSVIESHRKQHVDVAVRIEEIDLDDYRLADRWN